jgi:hypothetical protein
MMEHPAAARLRQWAAEDERRLEDKTLAQSLGGSDFFKPRWSDYKPQSLITLWEAVCLSVGINSGHKYAQFEWIERNKTHFSKEVVGTIHQLLERYKLALHRASKPGGDLVVVGERKELELQDMFAWAKTNGMDLPKDFSATLTTVTGTEEKEFLDLTTPSASNGSNPDLSLCATPAELLDTFKNYGAMKQAWFRDLNSRKWLLEARKRKGQGQRGCVIKPLFCPYLVMLGLMNKVRKADRLTPDTAWRRLEHKFPKVYAAYESHDPREQTGG